MKKKVFVVSHTHWDREWYLTKSQFQMMNVDMMEQLLAILDDSPEFSSFMLDGQLVALEDYLSVCPQQKEHIRQLVKDGRLVIGPWYVLPDEYLASGEAHIRNFQQGMRLAEEFGGGMRLGYLPDSFGHPSQIPQLIAGLGMEEMIFWRGPGPEVEHAEFDWIGKDGTEILALNMVYGYSNAANLKADHDIRTTRLDHEIDKLMKLSHLDLVLLMNGSDHIAPDGRVAQWIAKYQKEHPDLEISHCTLQQYVCEAKRRRLQQPLQKVHNELRSGYRAYLLGDTLSTRMPIKQAQRCMEVLMENQLEPLFVLLRLAGLSRYPKEKLTYLWKLILQNLPHDSICGCSIDEVHREMFARYAQMQEIGEHLLDKAKTALTTGMILDEVADGELTVISTALRPQMRLITATLKKTLHPLRYVDYEQDQKLLEFEGNDEASLPTGVCFTCPDGHVIHAQVTKVSMEDTVECCLMTQPTMNRVMSVDCSFAAELPAMAMGRFSYRFTYEVKQETPQLSNKYFTVVGEKDGSLSVLCKETGRWYDGLAKLVDTADVGDEYTFDALVNDTPIGMKDGSVTLHYADNSLTIHGLMELPRGCSEDRAKRSAELVSCPVCIEVNLPDEIPYVKVKVTVDNQAKDHRLMALFPLGKQATACFNDSTFAIEQQKIVRNVAEGTYQGWMEKPNNSFFQKNFADLSDAQDGLTVMVKGLPQYEVQTSEQGDQIRLTLMRCVGWLSRKDLKSRDGNGGWTIATPEAQIQGTHAFEFAIMPHGAGKPYERYQEAINFVAPPIALQTSKRGAGELNWSRSWCELLDMRIAFSTLKTAQEGSGIVLRLCNMSSEAVQTPLKIHTKQPIQVTKITLDERFLEDEKVENGIVSLSFGPWQILTILVRGYDENESTNVF